MKKQYWMIHLFKLSGLLALALLALLLTNSAHATPPIEGNTVEFADSGQSLGSANSARAALGDLDGDGDLDAFIANGNNGPNAVWTNNGNGTFTDSGQSLGSSGSQNVALGDLDGDGDLDVFVGNYLSANTVWINDGSGTFSDSGQILGGNVRSFGVALGDMDGDGDLDAFIANEDVADEVWVNDGAGNFSDSGQALTTTPNQSRRVALGDVDGDGDLDAFVTHRSGYPNRVWLNDGSGIFSDSGQALGNADSISIRLGDLDSDGDLDAFVGNNGANTVWTNNGSGTFSDSGQTLGSSASFGMDLGDLDNDGDLDAFVSNTSGQANLIWVNNGSGVFSDSGLALGNSNGLNPDLGDLDNDGDLDAFVPVYGAGNIVWRNDLVHRNAPFPAAYKITITANFAGARAIEAADLDGDGDEDVIGSGNSGLAWWENALSDGTAWTEHTIPTSVIGGQYGIDAADIDGDGDLDLVVVNSGSDIVAWWENTAGDGSAWTEYTIDGAFDRPTSVFAVDIDSDGDIDVLSAAANADEIAWWENIAGNGSAWTKHSIDASFDFAYDVYAADLDGDGDLDVLGSATYADEIAWWENTAGNGSAWTKHSIDAAFDGVYGVYAADLDQDGDLDVLGAATQAHEIAWWENTAGNGSAWTKHSIDSSFGFANDIYAADLDQDGDLDVLGADSSGDEIAWWENTAGDGSAWTKATIDSAFDWVNEILPTDIDGDGDLDVLAAAWDANDIAWWRNAGGSAGFTVTDTSISSGYIGDGVEDDVLSVVFTHNGIAADRDLELAYWNLDLLASDCSTPLTTGAVNTSLAALRVRLDDGDGVFETDGSDVQVGIVSSPAFSLDGNGAQQVSFTNDDADVQVSGTNSATYWISFEAPVGQGQLGICARIDPDAGMLVEGKTPDFSVSIQDSTATTTSNTPTAVTLQTISASTNNTPFILLAMMMIVGVATAAFVTRRKQA